MSWLATIVTALLTAAACGGGTLWLATRCVEWYRIPSREGQSGYFVAFLMIGGALAGLVIGAVTCRVVVSQFPQGGPDWFVRGPLTALAVAAMLLSAAILLCWLRADIPPTLDGATLELLVEFRLPPGAEAPTGDSYLSLASVNRTSHVQRCSEAGRCIIEGSRREDDGRWIVPGCVPVFTQRGIRILRVKLGAAEEAFFVPLPARPGTAQREWSEWLPRPRTDGGPAINTLKFRFRVAAESAAQATSAAASG